jgi:hypothetical protein
MHIDDFGSPTAEEDIGRMRGSNRSQYLSHMTIGSIGSADAALLGINWSITVFQNISMDHQIIRPPTTIISSIDRCESTSRSTRLGGQNDITYTAASNSSTGSTDMGAGHYRAREQGKKPSSIVAAAVVE